MGHVTQCCVVVESAARSQMDILAGDKLLRWHRLGLIDGMKGTRKPGGAVESVKLPQGSLESERVKRGEEGACGKNELKPASHFTPFRISRPPGTNQTRMPLFNKVACMIMECSEGQRDGR